MRSRCYVAHRLGGGKAIRLNIRRLKLLSG
jgi:hypothetical protein